MIEIIGEPAMFEQLAEEASELAQAASKMARKMRGENPTPLSYIELLHNFKEEVTDVTDCLDDISHHYDMSLYDEEIHKQKMERFENRLSEVQAKKLKEEIKKCDDEIERLRIQEIRDEESMKLLSLFVSMHRDL